MTKFETGQVVEYPYLWLRESESGQTEGLKERPSCLAHVVEHKGEQHVMLVAITSTSPRTDQEAIEIPAIERRRGGVDNYPEAWIILDEFNYDVIERSYYFDPNTLIRGSFSKAFLMVITRRLETLLKRRGGRVNRTS